MGGDKMIKTAICDDEPEFIVTMSAELKRLYSDIIIIDSTYTSPEKLLNDNKQYDILFLDIDMPEMDGMELSDRYGKDTEIVFVTNHEALVFKAYNATDSFGFIRKSKLSDDLQSVMRRFLKLKSEQKSITIKINEQLLQIKYCDIFYIEKQINHIIIHTKNNKYTIRKTLSEIETMLSPFEFVRTHIGYLVNLDKIQLIEKKRVILQNSNTVPVSRSHYKNVCSEFMKRSALMNE